MIFDANHAKYRETGEKMDDFSRRFCVFGIKK